MLPLVNLHLCANKTQHAEMLNLHNIEEQTVGTRTSFSDNYTVTLQSEPSHEHPVGAQVGSDIILRTNKGLSPGIPHKTSLKGLSLPMNIQSTLEKSGRALQSNVINGILVGNKASLGPKNQDNTQV